MKKLLVLALLLVSSTALAQTPPAEPAPASSTPITFTVGGKAIGAFSNGQEVAATDIVAILSLTKNLSVRSDNIVTADGQSFLNGVQYVIPVFSKVIAKTDLPQKFQLYVTGGLGPTRNSTQQALAGTVGGGINYDPSSNGHFTVNLIEGRFVSKLPGPNKLASGVVVSSGLSISF